MKKIIAAFDGLKYSETTRDYAIDIARLAKAQLIGVFLDDYTYNSFNIYDLVVQKGVTKTALKKYEDKDKAVRAKASKDFETACQKAGIEFAIHHNTNIAIQELLNEGTYADLLIIDAKEAFTRHTEAIPTRFIRDLLSDVQCPVLLVSGKYQPLKKISLLYDGEPSSVHAVKMFSYLLPALKTLPTEMVSVKNINSDIKSPNQKLINEFMKGHFPKAKSKILKGFAEKEISNYLKAKKENTLIVLGAYRRGTVSRWFRASMADGLMKELKSPLFIAHN